jgi:type IV secretory pathway VirB2 component (pilin)
MSLTPLQLNAAAGLLQNEGFGVSANLISAISSYENTTLIVPFLNTISVGSTGNILSANVITSVETLAANTCPALSDSVPTAYSSLGTQMITVVIDQANIDICGNNTSKLIQAVNQAEAYTSQTSIFINSAVNSQTYLGNTFTTMNNMITGSATSINLSTPAFGTDLKNLGQLINLKDLNNFGSPFALVQQLYSIAGVVSTVTAAFITAGVSTDVVLNITSPTVSVTDSSEKLMYQAMTQITGTDLNQILSVLGVVTVGITTMADLLNPLKLFPNSFQSLTAPTANGPVAIYVDSVGSINTNLIRQLPPYVISSLV